MMQNTVEGHAAGRREALAQRARFEKAFQLRTKHLPIDEGIQFF
jgi:hypothetical protein